MRQIILLLSIFAISCGSVNQKEESVAIIPQPNNMDVVKGNLTLSGEVKLSVNSETLISLVENFKTDVVELIAFTDGNSKDAKIKIELTPGDDKDESYKLETSKRGVIIRAGSEKGVFYGLQTLKQLLLFSNSETGKLVLPLLTIEDEPRFGWRGVMLDESRYFFGMEKVKQLLELMSLHKLNVFHWHLTDDPISLTWTVTALNNMLLAEKETNEAHYSTLSLLMNNLSGLEQSLRNEEKAERQIEVSDFNSRRPERQPLSAILTPRHPRFRFAVRLTLALLLGYGFMNLFHIEKGAWILLTSLIVCQQTYSATRQRLFHRIFGTLLGVVLGVSLAHLLPTLPGQMLLLLGSIYAFFFWLKKNYTIAAIFITIFVLAAFNLLAGQGVAVMVPRIIDTLIGGFLAFFVVRFIWPDWQYKQLPLLLFTAVAKNKRYFQGVYDTSITETQYSHNRRTAHNADNALTSAWKDMRREPKSKRHYQQKAFRLTDLNHALLSYISAFGVHNRKIKHPLREDELRFCCYVSQILQFVSETMSQDVDDVAFSEHIAQANEWEEEIARIKSDTDNQRIALIHNIARVSRELLVEARELRQVYS